MKYGSWEYSIRYRLHISSLWVAPALTGRVALLESNMQVAFKVSPGLTRMSVLSGVKPWGSWGSFSHSSSVVALPLTLDTRSRLTDLQASQPNRVTGNNKLHHCHGLRAERPIFGAQHTPEPAVCEATGSNSQQHMPEEEWPKVWALQS